ncbi:MAG: phenylalanine--tRNA ligase beta subunit-related protein [Thermomicrobiales bacterium]
MKFGYDAAVLEAAPTLAAGVLWCRGLDNLRSVPSIEVGLIQAENVVRERFPNTADIALHPAIAAWRRTYSSLGLTPNRYPCAAESLIRRVVGGGSIPQISPLVDLCNSSSLEHSIPVAPVDLHLAEGNIVVRKATGSETYRSIGSDDLEPVPEGEVVYADDTAEVLSRRWNWRQTAKSAIRPESRDVLITTEAVHDGGRDTVERVIEQLRREIEAHLGGHVVSDILAARNPWSTRPDAS